MGSPGTFRPSVRHRKEIHDRWTLTGLYGGAPTSFLPHTCPVCLGEGRGHVGAGAIQAGAPFSSGPLQPRILGSTSRTEAPLAARRLPGQLRDRVLLY